MYGKGKDGRKDQSKKREICKGKRKEKNVKGNQGNKERSIEKHIEEGIMKNKVLSRNQEFYEIH